MWRGVVDGGGGISCDAEEILGWEVVGEMGEMECGILMSWVSVVVVE